MTGRIVGLFGSSVLAISLCVPALAQETTGVVTAVDVGARTIALDDGTLYLAPDHIALGDVSPGMEVHLIFTS
jgi:hypothetical protein